MTLLPESLTGQYHLRPGQRPAILGQRPILQPGRLRHLLAGKTAAQSVHILGSVFTLCAHAHRRTAAAALAAAQASLTSGSTATAQPTPVFHLLETARDHLRSMVLDWPQRLSTPPTGTALTAWLSGCPLALTSLRPPTDDAAAWQALAQLKAWLAQNVLQQPVAKWLQQHGDPQTMLPWCQSHANRLLPLLALSAVYADAPKKLPTHRGLDILDINALQQREALMAWVTQVQQQPDFAQFPTWEGACAETGPWTRLRHRATRSRPSVWARLSSRWLELMELASATERSHATSPLLAMGTLVTGRGEALAWSEMARGLLFHWVQCDDQGAVLDYKVIAPTEWNFHPQGTLGLALQALPVDAHQTAGSLAAVFDPCVSCTV